MYKKAMCGLLMMNLLFLLSVLGVKGIEKIKTTPQPVYKMELDEIYTANEQRNAMGIPNVVASGQRIVDYQTVDKRWEYDLSKADMEALLRIVEAEAEGEDMEGKLLVANVVLNRVKDESFPDTVEDVVFQQDNGVAQFSPVRNGRYWSVEISEETKEAVDRALEGEDISQGALYFTARKYADSDNLKWFDEKLKFLFAHGGHEFFAAPN